MADEVVITVGDGARLAGTLYLPEGNGPFAALLEALPYRKDDVTRSYRPTYERYADAGFAVLRLDLRGTGSSTGVMSDEYPDIERTDLRTVIEWLASQGWSNGRVGMFGTSYSGFNSLQMAMEGVPELGAVVATYATDDRYTDDVHYAGGVLRALDLIDYPLYMVSMNALPPVPAVFGDGWRDEWLRRIDATPAWLIEWLEQPLDGPTWRRGSVRTGPDGVGYERMGCPTMLIVGWADGYRNNSFRVIEQYERIGLPWRMLAGPWVHKSPESARPGPNVDDDVEVIAFFDEHLRGGTQSEAAPAQIYVREPVRAEPDLAYHPGRWVDLVQWPPTGLRRIELKPGRHGVESLRVESDVGIAAWNSCGGGLPWGQPLDQRLDNARSLVHDWPIDRFTDGPLDLLGQVSVQLQVASDRAFGHLSLKLCDVAPDGGSTLITRGMLDLTHVGCWPADGAGSVGTPPRPLEPGEWIDATIEMEATTWRLLPGHVLRLAIAGTDWPNSWPPPGNVTLTIDSGAVRLRVPVVDGLRDSDHRFAKGSGPHDDEADGVTWEVEHDVLARETRVRTRYGDTYDGAHGATVTDDYEGELGVSTFDPANAWARGRSQFEVQWPDATLRTESTLAVVSTAVTIEATIELRVWEADVEIAHRVWNTSVTR